MTTTIYECPHCHGAVPHEHFAVSLDEGRRDEFLYCEFCERGCLRSIYDDGYVFTLDYVRRTEPDSFADFLAELEDARAA